MSISEDDLEKLQKEAAQIEVKLNQRYEFLKTCCKNELASVRLELLTAIVNDLPSEKRRALLDTLLDSSIISLILCLHAALREQQRREASSDG